MNKSANLFLCRDGRDSHSLFSLPTLKSTTLMVPMRLQCVVSLMVVALLTLCMTGEVTARTSGTTNLQANGLDALPVTHPLRPRRQWPARLLKSAAGIQFIEKLAQSGLGKRLAPHQFLKRASDRQNAVTQLFYFHNVESVNVGRFLSSERFQTWESQVKKAYGVDAERLMFETMKTEFRFRKNGGIEAIIAQAIGNRATEELGLRFEDMLLQELVGGVKAGTFLDERNFVRYALYRGSAQAVISKMQQLRDERLKPSWFLDLVQKLFFDSKNSHDNLKYFFKTISRGRDVEEVLEDLRPVKGFNNNAFMLRLLYDKATDKSVNVSFVEFVLSRLHGANKEDDTIREIIGRFDKVEIPYDLRDTLLNPMSEALKKAKPPSIGEA